MEPKRPNTRMIHTDEVSTGCKRHLGEAGGYDPQRFDCWVVWRDQGERRSQILTENGV